MIARTRVGRIAAGVALLGLSASWCGAQASTHAISPADQAILANAERSPLLPAAIAAAIRDGVPDRISDLFPEAPADASNAAPIYEQLRDLLNRNPLTSEEEDAQKTALAATPTRPPTSFFGRLATTGYPHLFRKRPTKGCSIRSI